MTDRHKPVPKEDQTMDISIDARELPSNRVARIDIGLALR